jgi:hypothetical protein
MDLLFMIAHARTPLLAMNFRVKNLEVGAVGDRA